MPESAPLTVIPDAVRTAASFADVLAYRVARTPDQVAFRFVGDDGSERRVLTYADLSHRAHDIAATLLTHVAPGARVLVAVPPGADYVSAIFACFIAGVVAVPAYPPHPRRADARIAAMVRDAQPDAALLEMERLAPAVRDGFHGITCIDIAACGRLPRDAAREADAAAPVSRDALAMLQYTSGSTGDPRGVMLTHAHLMANAWHIQQAMGHRDGDTSVFWLPPFHDMGLMGGILEPVYLGAPTVHMAPSTFMQRPVRWLEAMTRYRAAHSGAPDFAYALCAERVTADERATLDLSAWRVAFNGAEPVQATTMARFVDTFAPCGLSPRVFFPCYGLAEATLFVSGGPPQHEVKHLTLRTPHGASSAVVSCGRIADGLTVRVVHPETGVEVPDGMEGEIWVQGDSVAHGYWHRAAESAETFHAQLPGAEGAFLRTGDLGVRTNGELAITGRRKDLLIVQGRNIHPQDIEQATAAAHPLVRAGAVVAFRADVPGPDQVLVVAEVARQHTPADSVAVIAAVRDAVAREVGLNLAAVLLVGPHTVPRTSSGKLRRATVREQWSRPGMLPLVTALASMGVGPLDASQPLRAHGLESLDVLRVQVALETHCGHAVDARLLWEAPTLEAIAGAIVEPMAHVQHAPATDRSADITQWTEVQAVRQRQIQLETAETQGVFFAVHDGLAAATTTISGRLLDNFASYNYLGLSGHAEVNTAAQDAIARYGTSVSASRLIAGERPVHRALEDALAQWTGVDAALTFVGGHATNVTTIAHLMGAGDVICCDERLHNSAMQGAQFSGARVVVFPHNDADALDRLLTAIRAQHRRALVVIEGVYSADGDIPDLAAFVAVKQRHDALLMVDEAHAVGVLGATGRGSAEHATVDPHDVDIWMGTLSKALASSGGYIAGSRALIDYLRTTTPGFVFSVGLAPAVAAAAHAALVVLQREPQRVQRVQYLARRFRDLARNAGLDIGVHTTAAASVAPTPIVPVLLGETSRALRVSAALRAHGVEVPPMIAPAVPEHSARLRFFLSCDHTDAQIEHAVSTTASCLGSLP